MVKRNKISIILEITLVCLLAIAGSAHAEERHTVNPSSGLLREGPGSQYRVIKTLPSDQSFEVIETSNDWSRIRTKEGAEGWLQDRPLDSRPAEGLPVKEVSEMKKLQAELSEISKQFKQLEAASADEQPLKVENASLKAELSAMQDTMARLQQENLSLTNKQRFYWFFAGSAVFLLGWVIGKISIRRQRHSSLTL